MRAAAGIIVACAVATASVTGCSAQLSRQDASAAPPSSAGERALSAPDPSEPDDADGADATDPGEPAPSVPDPGGASTPTPPSSSATNSDDPASSLPPARTDVPDAAVLPAQQGVADGTGVVTWTLPADCDAGAPSAAAAMRTVTDGDGRFETVVRVQQVVVFADTAAAVGEAGRVAEVMDRCAADAADPVGLRTAGPVTVGAQGHGMGRYDAGGTPARGVFAAVTRRGNAVTLVAHTSGEATVQGSRRVVLADTQAAWERLCLYDRTAGCPG